MLIAASLPAGAAPAARAVPTHCAAGETPLYSCAFARSVGSLCGSRGSIHYRFGPAGHPTIDIANDARWSNVRAGYIVGGGGGRQRHIRFIRGGYSYVVFWAVGGQYTAQPGATWSGIVVADPKGGQSVLNCPGRARLAGDPADYLHRAAPLALSAALEDKDSDFDVWF